MKEGVKCLAAMRMFGSLYEAKQCGHKIVIPLNKRVVVIVDDEKDRIDLRDMTLSIYHEYVSELDGIEIDWEEGGTLRFVIKNSIDAWVYRAMGVCCITRRNFIKEILE